jgi:hypothetical protein
MASPKKTVKATASKQKSSKATPRDGALRADELDAVSGGSSNGLPVGARIHKPS